MHALHVQGVKALEVTRVRDNEGCKDLVVEIFGLAFAAAQHWVAEPDGSGVGEAGVQRRRSAQRTGVGIGNLQRLRTLSRS